MASNYFMNLLCWGWFLFFGFRDQTKELSASIFELLASPILQASNNLPSHTQIYKEAPNPYMQRQRLLIDFGPMNLEWHCFSNLQ